MARTSGLRPARHFRWTVIALAFAGSVTAAAVATLILGGVQGEELSPDTFDRRQFRYYEIPLFRIQITPVRHLATTNELELHLKKAGLLGPAGGSVRWDLVYGDHSGTRRTFSDARILANYLDARTADGDLAWLVWTQNHPQRAKVLWPVVAELARANLYYVIPELFHIVETTERTADVATALQQAVASQVGSVAQSYRRLGREKAASELDRIAHRVAPHTDSLNADSLEQLRREVESRAHDTKSQSDDGTDDLPR